MATLRAAIDARDAVTGARLFVDATGRMRNATGQYAKGMDVAKKSTSSFGVSLRSILPMLTGAGIIFGTMRLIRTVISATVEQERAIAQLQAGLKSTAGASGQTMKSLRELSSEMQRTTTFGDELTESAAAIMLSFTNIADDVFPRAMKATADIAVRMGTDLRSAVVQVAKALNDPIQNLGAMSRAGIQFSKTQKELIKSLWETGQQAEAQRVILAELENQYAGSASAARDTLGGALKALSNAFGDLAEEIGAPGLTESATWLTRAFEDLTWIFQQGGFVGLILETGTRMDFLGKKINDTTLEIIRQEDAWRDQVTETQAFLRAIDAIEKAEAAQEEQLKKSRKAVEKQIEALFGEVFVLQHGKEEWILYTAAVNGATEAQLESIEQWSEMKRNLEDEASTRERISDEMERLDTELADKRKAIADELQAREEVEIDRKYRADLDRLRLMDDLDRQIERDATRTADRTAKAWENAADRIESSFASAVADVILDGKSAEDAVESLIKSIGRMMVQMAITRGIAALSNRSASGTVFSNGNVVPFALGGVVDRPTTFPMSGDRTGLMGEGGPEAVMPLTRGPGGKLGIEASGAGQAPQTIIMHIQTPDADSFRKSRGQVLADMRRGASRLKG